MPVIEGLMDAKDEARQAEVRTDIAEALLVIEKRFASQTKWIVGVGLAMTAIIIAVLR
jgi:glutathione S-transferase